jgi:hypothetical protein
MEDMEDIRREEEEKRRNFVFEYWRFSSRIVNESEYFACLLRFSWWTYFKTVRNDFSIYSLTKIFTNRSCHFLACG